MGLCSRNLWYLGLKPYYLGPWSIRFKGVDFRNFGFMDVGLSGSDFSRIWGQEFSVPRSNVRACRLQGVAEFGSIAINEAAAWFRSWGFQDVKGGA